MYSAIDIGSCQCHPVSSAGLVQPQAFEAQADDLAWYCARTKPKHEHFAAAHLHRNLNLEVFHPRLRIERATQRGVVKVIEPLFPCYIFVRCVLQNNLNDIQRSNGVQSFVHFGNHIPAVADSIMEELQECFGIEDTITVSDRIAPGDEVTIGEGAFTGMRAYVLRLMPARRRVQVLLDILGGPTVVEVNRCSVISVKNTLADLTPVLAAPSLKMASV